jgi:hypothetical protein
MLVLRPTVRVVLVSAQNRVELGTARTIFVRRAVPVGAG